jgi:hypothetical protein
MAHVVSHHEDIMKIRSLCLAALLLLAAVPSIQAQIITNTEIERGLRFRGTPSYDGESYTQRYSYGLGSAPVYANGRSSYLYYLDYLDRADRAIKFGYRMPIDPYFPEPPPEPVVERPARAGIFGFGLFRRHN